MQHSIRLSLSIASSAALALASLPLGIRPLQAQEAPAPTAKPKAASTEAADLGVMGVNLKDAVKFNTGFQGAIQGAGTPNEAGIGAFIPLKVGDNSVFFLDTLANVNFSDFSNYSSIINTNVKGATVSTSTRLGYRWLNKNRSWMFGVNAGYDSRPLATGETYNGINVTDSNSAFFQQVALNLEASSNKWFTSVHLLYPIGEYGYNKMPAKINSHYYAGPVLTAGADIGYYLTPNLKTSLGYYYSEGDAGAANGNSVRGRLEYNIANGLTSGINIAYDPSYSEGYSQGEFYKTLKLSVDLKLRFGANGYGAPSIRKQQPVMMPVIQALSASPGNRDVRVHDNFFGSIGDFFKDPGRTIVNAGKKIVTVGKAVGNDIAKTAPKIIPVAVGVVSDYFGTKRTAVNVVTNAASPRRQDGSVVKNLFQPKDPLYDPCNGYIGRAKQSLLFGNECATSLRSSIERQTGTLFNDDSIQRSIRGVSMQNRENWKYMLNGAGTRKF